MLGKLTDGGKAFVFYAITLVLILAVALAPWAGTEVAMFTPLAAILIVLFVVTRDGLHGGGPEVPGAAPPRGLRAWPAALGAPLLVLGVAYGVVWATGVAEFSLPGQLTDASDRLGVPVWLLMPLATIVVPIFTLGLVTSLGEEIGWRGYFLPHLCFLGDWAAVLLTGLAHAAFHLPIILLTDLCHAGGNRFVVVPLFLVSVTVVGMFLGYLRLSTGSVWPAVLGHSAHNVIWNAFGAFTATSSAVTTEYVAGESGVLVILGYAALGGWLMYALTRRMGPSEASPAASGAAQDA